MNHPASAHEQELLIRDIGERLYRAAGTAAPSLFGAGGVRGALLQRALSDDALRQALFRFVDVLPQLADSASLAQHFRSYLDGHQLAGAWGRLLKLGNYPALAWAVRASVARMARTYLIEETESSVRTALHALQRAGMAMTTDAVGEAVLTEAEADAYVARYRNLLRWQQAAGVAQPQVSIKLTALTPRFDVLDARGSTQRVLDRLQPLLTEVIAAKAALTVDMEQYELKDLILAVFRELASAQRGDWLPGIALQAYLPDTERDLAALIEWARGSGRRIGVRLVKGAYWDTETAYAAQRHWPRPVYAHKSETDAAYERLTRQLFAQRDIVYPAIAGHNLRSLGHAIAAARMQGLNPAEWEIQMLHGMADPLARAVAAEGLRLRIYTPTGDLVSGIAYLIRRLLENTASTSVLRQTYAEAVPAATLLAAPAPPAATEAARCPSPHERGKGAERHSRVDTHARSAAGFANTPLTDFSRAETRNTFAAALRSVRGQLGQTWRLALPRHAGEQRAVNPAQPDEILGKIEVADAALTDIAIQHAAEAFPRWRATPAAQRIEIMLRAAGIMRERRAELAAWQVLEQGKNWREADADVAEAIDYLRYYAAQMGALEGWRATATYPGETNITCYEPRGVAAVIAPWNFPLAILTGMTSAALVSGNCALMKPAAPAGIVAHQLQRILLEAGVPPEVCQLLPGHGGEVGERLVTHAQVQIIAFTGSREVGLNILQNAARLAPGQTDLKRVVCEMGGKNAIIVDADADPDDAVLHVMHSAFGYQGQKCSACSRVITVGAIHDAFVARLAAALDAHPYGPPEDPQFTFGPMITQAARDKAEAYVDIGRNEGQLAYRGRVPNQGFYCAPAIFTGIQPQHRLAREEIFGPVLAVLQAASFEQAIDIALDADYALTGGVFSRLPAHLELARERFRVGNLYLNRRITGALVGTQPFGGVRLSGTGIPAGGVDYLKQFLWSRTVSESTVRHGYVP